MTIVLKLHHRKPHNTKLFGRNGTIFVKLSIEATANAL
jgi:hypothetical protein